MKGKADHARYAHTAYWMQTNLYLGRLGSAEGGIEGSSPLVMSFEVLLGGVDAEVEGAACEGLAGAAELETPLAEGGSAAVWLSWEASSVKASRSISQLLLRSADIVTAWLYSQQVCFQQHRRQPRYCIAQILQASYHKPEQRDTHQLQGTGYRKLTIHLSSTLSDPGLKGAVLVVQCLTSLKSSFCTFILF